MHTKLLEMVLALGLGVAATLCPTAADATALATVTVGGTTRTLSQSGFVFVALSPFTTVVLGPGQSADLTVDYSISVQDSGLPVSFDPEATGCLSLHAMDCEPTFTGFEVAKADLLVFYEDPRIANPFLEVTRSGSDVSTIISLETHSDSFAEALTKTGTVHLHVTNIDQHATYSATYGDFIGLWVFAVPEPAVSAQLAAGLGILILALRRIRPRLRVR